MRKAHVHLVSDATGETVASVARACIAQLEGIDVEIHSWWFIRSTDLLARVVEGLKEQPGIVLFTLVDPSIRTQLEEICRKMKTPCVPVLGPTLAALASHFQVEIGSIPGRQHQLDEEYFARIDAMQFTHAHDDGQMLDDVESADIVLVGVSRSSKTPTTMYLAYRGYKCANYPLVPGVIPPPQLTNARHPLVVGLTMEPESLAEIRRIRLAHLNQRPDSHYAQFETVKEEVLWARRLFRDQNWPVVDMTRRSIEEAAAAIIGLYNTFRAAEE